MARKQVRSKEWGRETENAALKALRPLFPSLKRVGSTGYSRAHPDLVQAQPAGGHRVLLVVTRDKRKQLLVTLSIDDLIYLTDGQFFDPVYVQVKARESTWIGRIYEELKANAPADQASGGHGVAAA